MANGDKTKSAAVTEAMTNADAAADDLAGKEIQAVAAALEQKMAPVFNTFSQSFAGRLIAEERAVIEQVANIDRQIEELNAQRTDAMLTQSGITSALNAMQRNR